MKITKGRVYLSKLTTATYAQRLFYLFANHLRPDWSILAPNFNPLDWCLRDIGKLLYIAVLFAAIYPFVMLPLALYEARRLKTRYADDDEWGGVYCERSYWLEADK